MDKVINLGIPHVGELVFESFDTPELIKCLEVSKTWKVLAENVLIKKWNGEIFEACKTGETKIVQLLLECCNTEEIGLNIRDREEMTPLMWACENGHKDVVKLLLNYSGPNIELNARDEYGRSALMVACFNGHKDVVQLLLDHPNQNIEVNATTNFGFTAFMLACWNGHKDIVKLLMEYSHTIIDLNAENYFGGTALMCASQRGHQDIVQLIEAKLYRRSMRLSRKGPK